MDIEDVVSSDSWWSGSRSQIFFLSKYLLTAKLMGKRGETTTYLSQTKKDPVYFILRSILLSLNYIGPSRHLPLEQLDHNSVSFLLAVRIEMNPNVMELGKAFERVGYDVHPQINRSCLWRLIRLSIARAGQLYAWVEWAKQNGQKEV